MERTKWKFLYWTPRLLGLLLGIFVGLFALDVFSEDYGPGETLLAFLMHIVPAALVLGVLAIAWRWAAAGGILFFGMGIVYLVWAWGKFSWPAYALLTGIPCLLGVLFLLNWHFRAELTSRA
jgi:hypothetical protein